MSDAPRSEWERVYEESVRREEEATEPQSWSGFDVRGWLLAAALPGLAVKLTLEALGIDANWPAAVAFIAVPVAAVGVSVRRHLTRQKRDRDEALRRYRDAAPPTSDSDNK